MNIYRVFVIVTICFTNQSLVCMEHHDHPVCPEERHYIDTRTHYIQAQFPETHIPRIGLCFSGGGHRAMCSTLSFIIGAKKIKLLDAAQYISTLSGSTWGLASLLLRHIPSTIEELTQFKDLLQHNIEQPFWDWRLIDYMYTHNYPVIDIWGKLITHHIFSDLIARDSATFNAIHFSDLEPNPSQYPYPIFTAIQDLPGESTCCGCCSDSTYDYLDVSPYYIWSEEFQTGVTTPSFEHVTQFPLSFFLGLFGSAYSLSPRDVTSLLKDECKKRSKIIAKENRAERTFLEEIIKTLKYNRLAPPIIPNIGFGQNNEFNTLRNIAVVDAGISFNLPIPALTRRNIDVLIICDADANAYKNNYDELRKALKKYILPTHTPFPSINKPSMLLEKENPTCNCTSTMMAFTSLDPEAPLIIYFPNKIKISTFHFQYTQEECRLATSFMESTLELFAKEIWELISMKAQPLRTPVLCDNTKQIKKVKTSTLTSSSHHKKIQASCEYCTRRHNNHRLASLPKKYEWSRQGL
jgi:hypothetical protein